MPSVSFCLFAHPIQRSLSIYLSGPPHANKQNRHPCILTVGKSDENLVIEVLGRQHVNCTPCQEHKRF